MNRLKVPRLLFALLVLALTVIAQGQGNLDSIKTARQLAAEANDEAATLTERQEALRKLNESAQLFVSAGEILEAARVLNRVGHLQLILNSPLDAITTHNKALDLLKQSPSPQVEVDNLNGLAAALMLQQDKSLVEPTLNRAISLSEQSSYTAGHAQALLTLSRRYNFDDHARALSTAQNSLNLWKSIGDKRGIARAYEQVGICYRALNVLLGATQSFEQALPLWQELNDSAQQATALIMLGFIDLRKAEWQSSISRFVQAQGLIDEAAEPQKMGQIACGMAEVYNEYNLPEHGLIHYKRALTYYQQTQDAHLIWYATWGLGWTHYLLHEYPEALSYLQQSLTHADSDSGPEAALTREYIAMVHLETGEYPAALQDLQFAFDVYTRAVNPFEAARVQGLIGQVLEQQGQFARARGSYLKAVDAFGKLSDQVNQAAVYYALGRLELKRGKYVQAEDFLSRSIQMTEKMHRIPTSRDLSVAFFGSVHDRYQAYIECLMGKHQSDPALALDVKAFETSEAARARSLAEFLRATNTDFARGVDSTLAQQEKSLRQSIWQKADYRSQLLTSKETASSLNELKSVNTELSQLEAEYGQLIETINQRYPAYKQITQPTAWDVRRIQEEIIKDDQTLLLEYSIGASKSYVWAVTHDKIKTFEIPGEEVITQAARKVSALLALPPASDTANQLTQASQELSQMILSPVAAELNKRVVIVVADGALHYIPFQVLPMPSGNEPLVAKFEIVNAPSASIIGDLRQERERRKTPTKLLAAFGDPVFYSTSTNNGEKSSDDLIAAQTRDIPWRSTLRDVELNRDSFDPSVIAPLFYAARELRNLRDLAGGGGLVLGEFAATRERLLNTDLSDFAILHLATHGFLDPKRPEYSGLLLSTVNSEGRKIDGFVGLQDIYQLRAPVNIVVLSACQTALGKDVRGEGLVGMTRGFIHAGASSVVASLWSVDDGATAELMKRFYSNLLQQGMSPAEALRAAQNSIRQEPEWASPYYWGAFTIQGDYQQLIKPLPQTASVALSWKILIVFGLLLLLGGVGWWYRRRRTLAHVRV
ncbi:MAG TPA: CHAT domain-containing tetratricopeptide repeat protein [Pyrinomonadaceae bacterium]|nr:CHAT domain-containing tetratricopeptide repeat protein [Pyrinomonadaceae bacterium]